MPTPEENMRATPGDRMNPGTTRSGGFPVKAAIIVAVIAAGLFLLFYPGGDEAPPESLVDTPPPTQAGQPAPPPLPPAEDIPVRDETPAAAAPAETAAGQPTPAAPPLPAPEDSDPLLKEQLEAVGVGGTLSGFTEGENLVQRMVALVDGASRGELLRKILPMQAPRQPFPVQEVDGTLYMSEGGYDRYAPYVDAVVALDNEAIARNFHQLRPLYEKAYSQLGLPPDDLDNALIRILDRIIATPVVEEPLALEQKNVMYTFADPTLEALPGLQKQLLRMGPDNLRRLQEKARALRAELLEE